MKKIIFSIFATAFFTLAFAQTGHENHKFETSISTPNVAIEVLRLKETQHDFSQIPQGKPVFYSFEITNTGTTELKL
ncbi:MAG: hypothetical protein ABIU11_08225, partial [Chitinophagaceae bacterium]